MSRQKRRPAVGIALVFVAGTWIGLNLPFDAVSSFSAAALCLVAALIFFATDRLRKTGFAAFAADGATTFFIYASVLAAASFGAQTAKTPACRPPLMDCLAADRNVEITGVITDEPFPTRAQNGGLVWRFPVMMSGMRTNSAMRFQASALMSSARISGFPGVSAPTYGDRVIISGRLGKPAEDRIVPVVYASSRGVSVISSGNGSSFVAWCLGIRRKAARTIAVGMRDHAEEVSISQSLILGAKGELSSELYRAFASTGTLHVFAISGSHVVVIAALVLFVVGACRIPRTRWIFFLAPVLVIYTVMTGLQPSAVRACVMAIVFWTAPLFHRKADIFASLAVSAIAILAWSPEDLENRGFVLSFVAVIGIVLLFPLMLVPVPGFLHQDPLKLGREPRWMKHARGAWTYLAALIATSVAAWLVSTPITALYFGIFSPIALLGNLVAIPLSSLIVITGGLSLTLGSIADILANILNHANMVLVRLLAGYIRAMAAVPSGWWNLFEPPPTWLVVAIYAALSLWVMTARSRLGKREEIRPVASRRPETCPRESR